MWKCGIKEGCNTKKQILIVEDDTNVQGLMIAVVQSMNCCSYLAKNCEEAINFIKLRKIDLALIDLGLPSIDGIELSRRIKTIKPDIPIILMSGVNLENSSIFKRLKGFTDFIAKPFNIQTVTEKIRMGLTVVPMISVDRRLDNNI